VTSVRVRLAVFPDPLWGFEQLYVVECPLCGEAFAALGGEGVCLRCGSTFEVRSEEALFTPSSPEVPVEYRLYCSCGREALGRHRKSGRPVCEECIGGIDVAL